jgi:hypothetical protein
MEISGTVEAVGEAVSEVSVGQRVVAVPLFGGHAEKVVVPARRVFPLPDGVDLTEAAAVPVVFLTAWYACEQARVAAGERVVVTAAAGGVGQLCSGCSGLGARRSRWSDRRAGRPLPRARAGRSVRRPTRLGRVSGAADVVIDAIGGRVPTLAAAEPAAVRSLGFAAASAARRQLSAARELLDRALLPYSSCSLPDAVGFNLSLLPDRTGRCASREDFELWKGGGSADPGAPFVERLPDATGPRRPRTTGKVVIALGKKEVGT